MNGFETKELVEAQLAALRRELKNLWSKAHAEAVQGQIKVFSAELARLEAEGPPVDVSKNRGRSTLVKSATTGTTFQQWIR